jgi:hypothetical protein
MSLMSNTPPVAAKASPSTLKVDLLVGAAVSLMGGAFAGLLAVPLLFTLTNLDVWFDSDSLFVVDVMTNRWSEHHDRNNLHPLFGVFTYPLVFVQTHLLGLDRSTAVVVVVVAIAALWTCLIYATLRLMKRSIPVAVLFTAISLVSTPGVLFLGLVERHIAGSVSILVCVVAFLAYERGLISRTWLVLAAAGTLTITITNFMIGLAALVFALGWRKAVQAAINAGAIVVGLSLLIPPFLFPTSAPLLDPRYLPYGSTFMTLAGTPAQKTSAFWLHGVVIPDPIVESKPPPHEQTRYLSVQRAGVTRHGPIGVAALALWVALLGLGLVKAYRTWPLAKVDVVLGLGVLGHFGMFLFYTSEIVLYTPLYVPLMLLIVSRVVQPPSNVGFYVMSVVFLGLLAWNNLHRVWQAIAAAQSLL